MLFGRLKMFYIDATVRKCWYYDIGTNTSTLEVIVILGLGINRYRIEVIN